jgi:hypothetical protein
MKRSVILSGSFALIAVVGVTITSETPQDLADVISPIVIVLGRLEPGAQETVEFAVRNPTSSDWMITGIERGCGCTDFKMHGDTIPAEDLLGGTVVFTAPHTDGPFQKVGTIRVGEHGKIPLIARGDTRSPLTVRPAMLIVNCHAPSENSEYELAFQCCGDGLEDLKVIDTPDWCTIDFDSPSESAFVAGRIVVQGSESHRGEVRIQNAKGFTLTVPVVVEVPEVVVSPSLLYFGEVQSGQEASAEAELRPSEPPYDVHVVAPDESLRVETDQDANGVTKLTVHLLTHSPGLFQRVLTVDVGQRTVRIPVVARVR